MLNPEATYTEAGRRGAQARNDDLDFVAEQVARYFGNNTFSLEPR